MATIRDITCIDWPTVSRATSMATDDGVGRATDTVYFASEEGTESIAQAIEEVYKGIMFDYMRLPPLATTDPLDQIEG